MTVTYYDAQHARHRGVVQTAIERATTIADTDEFIFEKDTDQGVNLRSRQELGRRGLKKYELRSTDFPSVDLYIPADFGNPKELIAQFWTRHLTVILFLGLQFDNIAHLSVVLDDTKQQYTDALAFYNARSKTAFVKIADLFKGNFVDHELVHHLTMSIIPMSRVPKILFEGIATFVSFQMRNMPTPNKQNKKDYEDYQEIISKLPDNFLDSLNLQEIYENSLFNSMIGAALIETIVDQLGVNGMQTLIHKWHTMQWTETTTTADFITFLGLTPSEIARLWKEKMKSYKEVTDQFVL